MEPYGRRAVVAPGAPGRAWVDQPLDLRDLPVGTTSLGSALVETHTDAFLVVHEGQLIMQWYAAPDRAALPQALMSLTKSFVGALAGILMHQGRLDPDALATAYVPELERGGYAPATVRDLLDMRTGDDYRETYGDPQAEVELLGRALSDPPSAPDLRTQMATMARPARHAGPFSYRSFDTLALGWVLERAGGASMPQLLAQHLLHPLGIEQPGSLGVDQSGWGNHAGGLALTARDLARFAQMLLDGGSVGSRDVIPAAFIRDTRHGDATSQAAFQASAGAAQGATSAPRGIYRNQFWVPEQGARRLLGLGIYGQLLLADADAAVAVVKLSSWPGPQDPERFSLGMACAQAVAEHLGGSPRPIRSTMI